MTNAQAPGDETPGRNGRAGLPLRVALQARARKLAIPLHISFELTKRCNLACRHCYIVPRDGELPKLRWVELVDEVAELGCMAITLTGGELALYDGWREVARAIKERRLVLSLLTNATLFGGEGLDAIADLHPLSVSASLYGSEPGLHDAVSRVSGSFERTVAALSGLRTRGVRCRIGIVLMQENVKDTAAIIALAQELDCEFRFDPTVAPRADGDRDVLIHRASGEGLRLFFGNDTIRGKVRSDPPSPLPWGEVNSAKGNCGAGSSSAFIDARGDVYACMGFPAPFGNVAATGFAGVWEGVTAAEHRRAMSAPLKACAACELRAACGVRCPRLALVEDGDLAGVSSRACELASVLAEMT